MRSRRHAAAPPATGTSVVTVVVAVAVVVATVVAACGGDGDRDGDGDEDGGGDTAAVFVTTTTTSGTGAGTPTDTAGRTTAGTTTRDEAAATTAPPDPDPAPVTVGDPRVAAVAVGTFDQPVDLVPRPGDEALYVVQQRDAVIRWVPDSDARQTALDLSGRLSTGNEQGLLGLAFSPDGAVAYVDFTDTRGTTTIAEYQVAADGTFDAATERVVLAVDQPYSNHNAGDLHVDDAGLLYVTLGDGGSAGDPERVASDPSVLLGSLLRIDPTPDGDRPYSIPPDNPFAAGPLTFPDGATVAGAPEVFAWGLRNPWKIAVDPVTGELWIPDVGQNEFEEVNVVAPRDGRPAGWAHDFGWSAFEGTARYNPDVPDTGRATPPVLTYSHGPDGCSISGGVPYRGTAIPALTPAFVYSDYCSGVVWALDLAGRRNLVLLDGFEGVTAIRADAAGELYVLESTGTISRLAPG